MHVTSRMRTALGRESKASVEGHTRKYGPSGLLPHQGPLVCALVLQVATADLMIAARSVACGAIWRRVSSASAGDEFHRHRQATQLPNTRLSKGCLMHGPSASMLKDSMGRQLHGCMDCIPCQPCVSCMRMYHGAHSKPTPSRAAWATTPAADAHANMHARICEARIPSVCQQLGEARSTT
jgi:hypothetical protein